MKISIVKVLVYTVALSAFALGFVAVLPGQAKWVYMLAGCAFTIIFSAASSAISRRNSRKAG